MGGGVGAGYPTAGEWYGMGTLLHNTLNIEMGERGLCNILRGELAHGCY